METVEYILAVDPAKGDIEKLKEAINTKFGYSERPIFTNVTAIYVETDIDLEALRETLIKQVPGENFILIGPTDGLVVAEGI